VYFLATGLWNSKNPNMTPTSNLTISSHPQHLKCTRRERSWHEELGSLFLDFHVLRKLPLQFLYREGMRKQLLQTIRIKVVPFRTISILLFLRFNKNPARGGANDY
jgi:hypothetical protein